MNQTTLSAIIAASALTFAAHPVHAQEQEDVAGEGATAVEAAESNQPDAGAGGAAEPEDAAAGDDEGGQPSDDAANAAGDAEIADDTAATEGELTDTAVDEAAAAVDPEILAYLDAGDAAAGERTYRLCMACHALDEGANRVGPSLYGIIGRTAGTVEGFRYSPANRDSGVTWTEDQLFVYLENPQAFIPRTIMAFAGVPSPEDRANVIAYIAANGGRIAEPAAGDAE